MNCPLVSASNLNLNLTLTGPPPFNLKNRVPLGIALESQMRLFILNSTGWDSSTSTPIESLDAFLSSVDFSLGHFKIFKKKKTNDMK